MLYNNKPFLEWKKKYNDVIEHLYYKYIISYNTSVTLDEWTQYCYKQSF
jgi:hypothetical protein